MKAIPLNGDYQRYEDSGESKVVRGSLMVAGTLVAIPCLYLLWLLLFIAAFLVAWFGSQIAEARRQSLDREIDRLVTSARSHPESEKYARALLEIARRDASYDSSQAIKAVGSLGEAARPIVPGVADLLKDDDRWVRMYAARSLAKLAHVSEPALAELIEFVREGRADDAGMDDAIEAIARIGDPAIKALPMLRKRLGQQKKSCIEGRLIRAIEYLEALERGDANAVYDDGCSCCMPSEDASKWPSSSDSERPENGHSVLEV